MKVVSSVKISERHLKHLTNTYPNLIYCYVENLNQEIDELKNADIYLTYGMDLNEKNIDYFNQLKWVQVLSAGIEKIPLRILHEKRVIVTNARGIHYRQMTEYTFAAILQLARKTIDIYDNQLNHKWDNMIRVSEIYQSTIGIIGLGSIGRGIVDIAKAFQMKVIGLNTDGRAVENVDKVYKPSQINELMAESDFVVVIVPLTEQTYQLIGKAELESMKPTAYLINIARGEVVEESALVDALRNKTIAGAVLDVFKEEPLPQEHPLWQIDNCYITPHLSGKSPKYIERAIEIFYKNMDLFLEKKFVEMENLIDPKKGY